MDVNKSEASFCKSIDIDRLNADFEHSQPQDVIGWASREFGDGLVMTSSFGAESAVLIHIAHCVMPRIRIVMVDTGYLFPETHRFMEQLRLRFNLNVWVYRTQNDPAEYLKHAGESDPSWRSGVEACCAANKNEPMERAMRELAPRAWLRGIRRNQAVTRQGRQFVEWSSRYGCFALSPLLNWSEQDVSRYLSEHNLPYHPLREQGFFSIGCSPRSCTRAVQEGEDPRSGRWAGQEKLECGINLEGVPPRNG